MTAAEPVFAAQVSTLEFGPRVPPHYIFLSGLEESACARSVTVRATITRKASFGVGILSSYEVSKPPLFKRRLREFEKACLESARQVDQ